MLHSTPLLSASVCSSASNVPTVERARLSLPSKSNTEKDISMEKCLVGHSSCLHLGDISHQISCCTIFIANPSPIFIWKILFLKVFLCIWYFHTIFTCLLSQNRYVRQFFFKITLYSSASTQYIQLALKLLLHITDTPHSRNKKVLMWLRHKTILFHSCSIYVFPYMCFR